MAKRKQYLLLLKGNWKTWGILVWAEPAWVEDWIKDGLNVSETPYLIPEWWDDLGLPVRLWCFIDDCLKFRNPFRSWRKDK